MNGLELILKINKLNLIKKEIYKFPMLSLFIPSQQIVSRLILPRLQNLSGEPWGGRFSSRTSPSTPSPTRLQQATEEYQRIHVQTSYWVVGFLLIYYGYCLEKRTFWLHLILTGFLPFRLQHEEKTKNVDPRYWVQHRRRREKRGSGGGVRGGGSGAVVVAGGAGGDWR